MTSRMSFESLRVLVFWSWRMRILATVESLPPIARALRLMQGYLMTTGGDWISRSEPGEWGPSRQIGILPTWAGHQSVWLYYYLCVWYCSRSMRGFSRQFGFWQHAGVGSKRSGMITCGPGGWGPLRRSSHCQDGVGTGRDWAARMKKE